MAKFAPHESIIVHEELRATGMALAKLQGMKSKVQQSHLSQAVDSMVSQKHEQLKALEQLASRIASS